ncbi:RNA pol II accessory factor, Cdc73 family-domain-containing protein [Dipodascopsis tothii]|uniref:RNA pol II accessory factor, Cdc73 family-domain-containing protein n=1 Tax=Dipodascopsis tothii TaxID=44089 RepID=UPI0034CDAE1C
MRRSRRSTLPAAGAAGAAGQPLRQAVAAADAWHGAALVVDGCRVDLRAIYFCWQCRDANVAEYISLCGEKDVLNLTFLERADLLTWLEGAAERSEYIQDGAADGAAAPAATAAAAPAAERTAITVDPRLARVYARERTLVDHNTVLRGQKPADFSSVRKEAMDTFISRLRTKAPAPAATPAGRSRRRRDPIVLLSPSASSLLSLGNIKQFLEEGLFVPPQAAAASSGNMQLVQRTPRFLGGGPLRFVVVDSPERFKPEYWDDRVVAVFTTGQAWQFKAYKWSAPGVLFQKVKGFCLIYQGDPVPDNVLSWNVDVIRVDRDTAADGADDRRRRQFRDREIAERIWERLERWMLAHGWGKR